MGKDHPFAKQPQQRHHQTRADGMDMHQIAGMTAAVKSREQRVEDCLQRLLFGGGQRLESHPFKLAASVIHIGGASQHGRGHFELAVQLRIEGLTMGFDTAQYMGDPPGTEHGHTNLLHDLLE